MYSRGLEFFMRHFLRSSTIINYIGIKQVRNHNTNRNISNINVIASSIWYFGKTLGIKNC